LCAKKGTIFCAKKGTNFEEKIPALDRPYSTDSVLFRIANILACKSRRISADKSLYLISGQWHDFQGGFRLLKGPYRP